MSGNERWRDVRSFDRRSRAFAEGGPHATSSALHELEAELLGNLDDGGPELPETKRILELKAAYMERGAVLRREADELQQVSRRPVSGRKAWSVPVYAKVVAVTAVVLFILGGLGFGSAYAMPGNPLYSLKRAGEAVYTWASGDDAATYAALAQQRTDELRYALDRGMESWYYPLASDAESDLKGALARTQGLQSGAAERVRNRSAECTARLEAMLREVEGSLTQEQNAGLQRGLEEVRMRLRFRGGSSSPSQQGQPSSSGGQQGGPQNGQQSPGQDNQQGGPQTAPDTQQQQQQEQPEQDAPNQKTQPEGSSQSPGNAGQPIEQGREGAPDR